ncbi:sulfite exporter TauE/SafE family protein [Streptomyces sp. NPDC046866]|uniref:sulfite exporter TauE/SafE family protein n=1 Tax=Streptomyces sp. NPDC046866 TaxID=3154921 RepID=UPI00345356E9
MTRTEPSPARLRPPRTAPVVFAEGAAIGVPGGMIGLGGAEFRLPLLMGLFGFAALSAVILNKAMSLVVVLVALPARLAAVPAAESASRWPVAADLLAGSLLGAWAGASWAVRMRSATPCRPCWSPSPATAATAVSLVFRAQAGPPRLT